MRSGRKGDRLPGRRQAMGVRRSVRIAACIAGVSVLGIGAAATASDGQRGFRERLTGYEEVPALSTTGKGTFRAFREPLGNRAQLPGDVQRPRVEHHPVAHPLRERDEQRADRRLPVHEPRQRPGRSARRARPTRRAERSRGPSTPLTSLAQQRHRRRRASTSSSAPSAPTRPT